MFSINDIKMKPKLLVLFLIVGILPLSIAIWVSQSNSSQTIREQAFNQLNAVRDMKKSQIERFFAEREGDMSVLVETVSTLRNEAVNKLAAVRQTKANALERYFQTIEDQSLTLSKNAMIVQAMKNFKKTFPQVAQQNNLSNLQVDTMKDSLYGYYRNDFSAEYEKQNDGHSPQMQSIFTNLSKDATILQYYYIQKNINPLGSKHLLDRAEDQSQYSQWHEQYHPIIRDYLDKFGYYDIFLVDADTGNIVYSVFKELDFGTSLKNGPFSQSNIADAYQQALQARSSEQTYLVDYKQYLPSYEAPASFISSPIYDGEQKIGILIFQIPIDRLNTIMGEREGLGKTGETYLVGTDRLMRSDSFLDVENRSVLASFKNPAQGKVETMAVKNALEGQRAIDVIIDYNGNPVLSAYTPVHVGELTWALLAEIDVSEAFCPQNSNGEYFFKQYKETYGYYDLFLINPNGYAFYTVEQESD